MRCRAAIVPILLLVATGCRSPGAAPTRGAMAVDVAIVSPPPLPALPPYEEPRPIKVDTSSWPPVANLSPVVRYERPLRKIRDAGFRSGFVVANSESKVLVFARSGPAPIGEFPIELDVPDAFAAGAGEAGVQMLYFAFARGYDLVARELPNGAVRFVVSAPPVATSTAAKAVSCGIPDPFEIPGGVLLGDQRIDADGRVRWRTDLACAKPLGLVGERAIFLAGEVTALDLRDGRPIWQVTLEHGYRSATLLGPVIVIVEDTERASTWLEDTESAFAWLTARTVTPSALALTALDATTGAKRWSVPIQSASSPEPELSGANKSVLLRFPSSWWEATEHPSRLYPEPIIVFDRDTGAHARRDPR